MFNRIFLLSGLLISTILPLVYITKTITLKISTQDTSAEEVINTLEAHSTFFSWASFLLLMYTLGVALFVYRLIIEGRQLRGIIKKGHAENYKEYTYIVSDKSISPFSFFKWIVYNPALHADNDLEAILEHEKIHSNQRHSLDIILMELCLALQWFNPFAWLYRKSLKENLEFLADANVSRTNMDKKEYQYILLKQAVGQHNLSIVNPFFNSLIKKRIVMINQNPSNKLKAVKGLFILPFLALFLLSFNVKTNYVFENAQNVSSPDHLIELVIDKTTTDEQLMKIKNDLKKDNIDFSYTTVRNSEGEISSLSIEVSGGNKSTGAFSSRHNSLSDNDTISPTYVSIDTESNSVSIGNGKGMQLHKNDDASVWIHKSGSDEEKKEIIIKNVNGTKHIVIDGKEASEEELEEMDIDVDDNSFILIEKDEDQDSENNIVIRNVNPNSQKHIIIRSDSDEAHDVEIIEKEENGFFFIDSDGDKEPLLSIDGKKSNRKEVKKLDPSAIKSINVIKGTEATKKYGKKAKDGVIEITTN